MTTVTLDASLLAGFSEVYLKGKFDEAVTSPEFHTEMWTLATDPDIKQLALAAPRNHAKSTAVTHVFTLAAMVFGFRDYALIVSDTEGQAVKFLGDIKLELTENEALIADFGIKPLIKDTETEIIVQCNAGIFNITAKGAEQKVRGLKWRNRRPNLVVVDDLENDEMVMNKDRREKLRTWFLTALIPCGSKRCLFRMVGTVLHLDSLLNRLLTDKTWVTRRYEAHNDDFTQILWPTKFSADMLRGIRNSFLAQGKSDKYAQEYLNRAIDDETSYYKAAWFRPRSPQHRESRLRIVAAVDLAVSTKQTADYTAIVVAGTDEQNQLHIVEVRRGRWDSLATTEQLFEVQRDYQPELFMIERGPLQKAFGPFLAQEMLKRNLFINLHELPSTVDKMTRARGMQAKMKIGAVLFDQDADWYPDLLAEMTQFPRALHDDMVDAMSLLGQGLNDMLPATTAYEQAEEEYQEFARSPYNVSDGRSEICGY